MDWYVLQNVPVFLESDTVQLLTSQNIKVSKMEGHTGVFKPKTATFDSVPVNEWIKTKRDKDKFPDPKKLKNFLSLS